jgi:hypothetical protein
MWCKVPDSGMMHWLVACLNENHTLKEKKKEKKKRKESAGLPDDVDVMLNYGPGKSH